MTRKMVALATAAAISMTALAPAAHSMNSELNMLMGIIYNELKARDLPTDDIDSLSLADIAVIKGILDGDDSENQKTRRIKAILDR